MEARRGRRYFGISVVLLLLTTTLAGCGQSCTDLACSDRVTFQLSDSTATAWGAGQFVGDACIGNLCNSERLTIGVNGVRGQEPEVTTEAGTLDPDELHTVALTVTDGAGNVVFSMTDAVTLETWQPNGPRCEPTCAAALIAVDPTQPAP